MVTVDVRGNDVNQALRRLKKITNRERIPQEVKMRRHFEKPFEVRRRRSREAVRRARKAAYRRRVEEI